MGGWGGVGEVCINWGHCRGGKKKKKKKKKLDTYHCEVKVL